jgi:hypothetical protein
MATKPNKIAPSKIADLANIICGGFFAVTDVLLVRKL